MYKSLFFALLTLTLILVGCTVKFDPPEETIPILTILEAPNGFITRRQDGSFVSTRPQGIHDIQYIMLHAISDAVANPTKPYELKNIAAIFEEYSVDSHYVIDRNGTIFQFVKDDQVAYHAGIGTWNNDPRLTNNMNRYAIGIELLGIGTKTEMADVIGSKANNKVKAKDRGFTQRQYKSLALLLEYLREKYGIPQENIITHKAYDPGRKWDPGVLFTWPTT